jgi:hypothetical protein
MNSIHAPSSLEVTLVKYTNCLHCLCAAHRTGATNYMRHVICTDTAVSAGHKCQQVAEEPPLETDAALAVSSQPEFR